jgi:predicted nucleic acid-binding protein
MTAIVVDASLVVDAALGHGDAPRALTAIGAAGRTCIAPPLLWSEVTSALHAIHHRGVLVGADVGEALAAIDAMPVRRTGHADLHRRAWEIADRMGWARTYDAEYCALAELEGCELVTSDARLRRAADGRLPYVLDAAEAVARG